MQKQKEEMADLAVAANEEQHMIYMDHNSTTPIRPEVTEAMMPYLKDKFYNPSASYKEGLDALLDVNKARDTIAKYINANFIDEIYFTASGSEADNWALKGMKTGGKPIYIITDNIEHHAILNAAHAMSMRGEAFVRIIKVDTYGRVSPKDLEKEISHLPSDATIVVSIMMINNEIGTMQDIKALCAVTHRYRGYFHTDAVQAFGKTIIDVQKLGVDMLSASSHKIGAPRGCGFLYIRKGTPIVPLIDGGQQEGHMRAGTENVAAIVGLAKAAELACRNCEDKILKLDHLRDYFALQISTLDNARINNYNDYTFPNTLSVNLGLPAEEVLAFLNEFDICTSSGSACNSRDNEPSHVLKAIGLSDEEANNTIRFSLSTDNTKAEIDTVITVLKKAYEVMA